jgi:hypothetical protein
MNPSVLVLLGAFDTLIYIIQSERQNLCDAFDANAAIRTLEKIKANLTTRSLAYAQAEIHAAENFRETTDHLIKSLPQGSDLEKVLIGLRFAGSTLLPEGSAPPWPSHSSSKSTTILDLNEKISELIVVVRRLIEQRSEQ